MNNFIEIQKEETAYLEEVITTIKSEIEKENEILQVKRGKVIDSRREMWQESSHASREFARISEMNQYLSEINTQTRDYLSSEKRIYRYNKMITSPYFGRIDFTENGYGSPDKIYIGLYNLMNTKTDDIYVYDWRSPIASIFYRNELGKGSYKSPAGIISGDILLKRQYKIENSKLKYFFDSSIKINDEILQEVLSRNSSSKMKSIVQTIQKEQDIIIRDIENELLMVQGVAGSGKTSIALHRIAFLLYEGLSSKLNINDVLIISPNAVFSKYTSQVLPELGEENVDQVTFDDLIQGEKRQQQMEKLITFQGKDKFQVKLEGIKFKGSQEFVEILNRLLKYCERKLIPFKDAYYHGNTIVTGQQLKNMFLDNKINIPMAKRLKRIESILLNKIYPLRKERLKIIEKVVEKTTEEHRFEIKSFSRLIAIKEAGKLMEHIKKFTEVDYRDIYKLLFRDKNLFFKLSKDIILPGNIDEIIDETNENLSTGHISYEDAAVLLYLKIKVEGNEEFTSIKQVVIDEAQDYYPMHYYIFKLLFKNARFTVLGDFNQTLERGGDKNIYDYVEEILHKRKSIKITLNKGYRSSFEINNFNQKLLQNKQEFMPFERREAAPKVKYMKDLEEHYKEICEDATKFREAGYNSIAIICKTEAEAKHIQYMLRDLIEVKLLDDEDLDNKNSVLIIPSYLAKGLEFDVVLVYDASKENYNTHFDKRLLYIACTRALHQLVLYYTGEKSEFIE